MRSSDSQARRDLELLSVRSEDTFNPYERNPDPKYSDPAKTGTRRDLRKLSEWIKMMREREENKAGGADDEPAED